LIALQNADGRQRRATVAAVAALVFCGAVTASEWFVPGVNLAYGNEGMHIAIAAIAATVCLVVGGLAWARFTRSRQVVDLAIAVAFGGVMFVESAFLLALPALLNSDQITVFSVWSSTAASVLAPAVLLAGTLVPPLRLRMRTAAVLVAAVAAALGTATALVYAYGQRLQLPLDPGLSPAPQPHPFTGLPAALVLQAAAAALMLAAAWRLLRFARGEEFLEWLVPALVIEAVASANYALFPSLYTYWIYTGDILRLLACIVLAGGIVIELRASVRRAIDLAVLEERRRLARDLHDGVAQELAFVASEVVDVPLGLHPSLPWIRSAVDRALFESRRAIAALTSPIEGPLGAVVSAAVEDVADRAGAALRVRVDAAVDVTAAERETILRVVREAATNATRHGHASSILVTIEGRGTHLARLTIRDDGCGIVNGAADTGFGLTSMRERIEAIGGAFAVQSEPGAGTTVQALWRSART
jgi:signal transduction histidine kinase